jgi:hypothetical protein
MSLIDRLVNAFRARFWLHLWRRHLVKLIALYPDLYSLARSFISPASFHIFNRLCDTLILLALAYAKHYPTTVFCPWKVATHFVEHYFGISRQILPNFTYAEFLKISQHVNFRHRVLESGRFTLKKERDSASGYSFDFDAGQTEPLIPPTTAAGLTNEVLDKIVKLAYDEASHIMKDILHIPTPNLESGPLELQPLGAQGRKKRVPATTGGEEESDSGSDTDSELDDEDLSDSDPDEPSSKAPIPLSQNHDTSGDWDKAEQLRAAEASIDAARYSALSKDLDVLRQEVKIDDIDTPMLEPLVDPMDVDPDPVIFIGSSSISSLILDAHTSKASIRQILEARTKWQSGTGVNSERIVTIHEKFELAAARRESEADAAKKMSPQEASHRLSVVQSHTIITKEAPKPRQVRWQTFVSGISTMKAFSNERE